MESYLEKLKQEVRCSLCNGTLVDPKILHCFHTFCTRCIKKHAEQPNVLKCPTCLAETPLPEPNGVDELKSSSLHSRILKVLAFVESEKVCSVCSSHSPASCHCFDCDRSMCDECKNGCHSVFTKDHKIVALAELKREDLEYMLIRENTCEYHTNQVCKFYCKDCDHCICVTCLDTKKCQDHHTIPITEQRSLSKAVMEETREQLQVKLTEMQNRLSVLKEIARKTKENGEQAKADVKETVRQLIAFLHESERELVEDTEQRIQQCILDQTQGALDYLTELTETGPSTSIDIPIKAESDFMFIASKELKKLQNAGIGGITTTDHTESTVNVESDLEALNKAKHTPAD